MKAEAKVEKLFATIGDIYKDPVRQWIMVRLDSCDCHCPFDPDTGRQAKVSPHVLRVYDLPVDEKWLLDNKGRRVEITTSIAVLAQKDEAYA